MVRRRYYRRDIPLSAQLVGREEQQASLSTDAAVSGGSPTLELVGQSPSDLTVEATFRGFDAERHKAEFDELFNADLIGPIPYYGLTPTGSYRQTPKDGYYTPSMATVEPSDPRFGMSHGVWRTTGRIKRNGTRKTHWRAVKTDPVDVDNEFGNDTTAYVGVDSRATKIRWFNEESEATEAATLVATRNAEYGDVEIYDADASSFSKPTLIFDIDYEVEGQVDPSMWDTRGNASKTQTESVSGETVLAWQRAYDDGHFFEGDAVIENGLVRLTFDEASNSLTAEEWNDGTSSWDAVSLGASDWQLYDLDVMEVWTTRVDAQVEFENTTDGSLYRINMSLKRGYTWPQWHVPPPAGSNGPTPSGLQDKLTPIANTSDKDPQESGAVVDRKRVRL